MASSRQAAALTKARAAKKAKHGKGSQTSAQLAAERSNLVLARAAQKNSHRAQTASQLAAERSNLVKARAASHSKHGKGHQTAKQLAAERANLSKARRHRHSHNLYHARKLRHGRIHRLKSSPLPLGTHMVSAALRHKQGKRKPTGINPRFKSRISSTSFDQRGSWKSARTHHMKRRLHQRHKRLAKVGHWRRRKGRLTPR